MGKGSENMSLRYLKLHLTWWAQKLMEFNQKYFAPNMC